MSSSDRSYKNVWPSEDRILVRPVEIPETTEGGIVLPDTVTNRNKNRMSDGEGIVLAKGPGRLINGEYVPTACKVGDTVVIGGFAGTEIKVDKEKLLILPWVEVLAIKPQQPQQEEQKPEVLTEEVPA